MAVLRIYSIEPHSPTSRCGSRSTWEEQCVLFAAHVGMGVRDHEDERGYTWVSAKPVDTAPHDALNEEQAKPLTEARIAEAFGVPARFLSPEAQTEALRELLSYCRTQAEEQWQSGGGPHIGYNDVAERLAKILDGES